MWSGLMQVASASGLTRSLARALSPAVRCVPASGTTAFLAHLSVNDANKPATLPRHSA